MADRTATLAAIRPLFVHGIIARHMAAAGTLGAAPRNDGHLHWHDTSIAVWEETVVDDDVLLREVMGPLIRDMRARGWKVGSDPRVDKHYACIARFHRLCRMGELQASIEVAGRTLKVELWQDRYNVTNPNGGRYDFDRLRRMPYLLRQRAVLEMARVAAFLHHHHGYPLGAPKIAHADLGRPGVNALDYIASAYARSGHMDKSLGRPRGEDSAYNNRSADGDVVRHGATVWFKDRQGRWQRAAAHYALNNRWHVVTGPWSLDCCNSTEIHVRQPASLRRQPDPRLRRRRLEHEMKAAAAALDFARAETLRRILFGATPLFRIWARDKGAWYATQSQGYTADASQAGLFDRAEAERLTSGHAALSMRPATAGAAPHG